MLDRQLRRAVKERLPRIQRKGGKASWEGVSRKERSALAKKGVAARRVKAKKVAAQKPPPKNTIVKRASPKKAS